ncbi:Predicted transcriptional regulator LiuR of leucine degradation pathway, MerR family [hydrothermal vent metagenome]|uniref:Predicted transcriptional regulator LiuR of leucine degradation pathway, MerR family n=1 Tax=hydrothermal vent metagenome TaxID=652676 RepID=A0A3B0SKD7_9ZZZZ
MIDQTSTFSISELAKEFSVTTRTIRYYEAEGLLSPARRGSHRVFTQRERTRLRLILRGKRIGLTLAEIAEIVDMYDDTPGERGQLELLIGKTRALEVDLQERRSAIDRALSDIKGVRRAARRRLKELDR